MGINQCVIYFNDFRAIVDQKDYERVVLLNDDEARKRIAESLDGVDLYFHGGPNITGVEVSLADLICHRIIPRVTLHKDE